MTALLRRLIGRPDLVPNGADALTFARRALVAADQALVDAVDWVMPPIGPLSDAQAADIARLLAAVQTARTALEEVLR